MSDEASITTPLAATSESAPLVETAHADIDIGKVVATESSNQAGGQQQKVMDAEPGQIEERPVDQWAGSEALLAEMRDTLEGLRRDFESKLMYDTGKQRQLDTLHEELESYRRGFFFQALRPVVTDLIELYNDMTKVAARLAAHEEQDGAAQEVAQFRDQIEEILHRNGFERYTSESDVFDGARQRAIDFVETSDAANDKRIAERLRPGFEYEGRVVVQVEHVKTYRYAPAAASDQS